VRLTIPSVAYMFVGTVSAKNGSRFEPGHRVIESNPISALGTILTCKHCYIGVCSPYQLQSHSW